MADEQVQATPAAAAQLADDTLIPVPGEGGKTLMEPLSKVRATLAEASRMRAQVAQYEARKDDLAWMDSFREEYAVDPEKARKRINLALGFKDPEAADADEDDPSPKVKRLEGDLARLAKVVERSQDETRSTRVMHDLDEALDAYALFDKGSKNPVHKIARTRAREFVIAAKATPDGARRPVAEIVSEVHADLYAMAVGKATETVQKREADIKTQTTLPDGAGTPAVTARPKATYADFKSGAFEKRLKSAFDQGGKAALGLARRADNRRT